MATLFEKVFNSISNRDEIEALQKIKAQLESASARADTAEKQVTELQGQLSEANQRAAQALAGSLGNEDRASSAEASNKTLSGLLDDLKAQLADMQQRNTLLQNISDTKSEQIAFLQGELDSAKYRDYTVQPGDSLSAIAQRALGDGSRWKDVFDANKEKIADPNLIHPGMVIRVPSH
ncbi:MAG: LysM peptidoglycan-binding domain-containing protein [Thermoflexales bacterium]|nr:LysM peptidoglycan-binding domain-containing protein [Thermoflexales bacterium]